MGAEAWAIALVLTGSLLGSLGPIMLKKASKRITRNVSKLIRNHHLFFGIVFYGIGTVLFVPALKGGDLNVLYPMVASSYVWVCLWSSLLLKERMNAMKWLGIGGIIVGVTLIGIGSM